MEAEIVTLPNTEHFEQIDHQLEELVAGLLQDNVHPDDISGPMMRQAIALLITTEGPTSTARHLRDLARKIETGGSIASN